MAELVNHAIRTRLEDLPASVLATARRVVLDTLAVLVAGSGADGVEPLLDQVRDWGGKPVARILVFGDQVPAPLAALVNGTMARALDYDDCDEETGDHPSVAAVPTVLVAADAAGGVAGADLLVGLVTGIDTALRIRRSSPLHLGPRMPWTTATFAPLTTAVAVSRTLRLDPDTFYRAVGVAFTECSNTMQAAPDWQPGSDAPRLLPVQGSSPSKSYKQRFC